MGPRRTAALAAAGLLALALLLPSLSVPSSVPAVPAPAPAEDADPPAERAPPKPACLYPKLAVALKTGRGVARERLPPVLSTWARGLCNLVLIADGGQTLNTSEVPPGFDADVTEAEGAQALTGTGLRDFRVRVEAAEYRVLDVVGRLYGEKGNATREPLREITVLHRHLLPGDPLPASRGRLARRGEGGTREGWSADAEKNVPGFVELWNRHPDADWYLMADDDAFFFLPAIMAHLRRTYNSSEPHYLGLPFVFDGCSWQPREGDRKGRLVFASGGAGIVLSRGALLAALPVAQRGLERTRGCWAGDVRVSIWMYEAGIRHTSDQRFRQLAHVGPRVAPWWDFGRACDPVLTYHHVPAAAYPRLWELQRTAVGNTVTNADLWRVFANASMVPELEAQEGRLEMDSARPGYDFLFLHPPQAAAEAAVFALAGDALVFPLLSGNSTLRPAPLLPPDLPRPSVAANATLRISLSHALLCLSACLALGTPTPLPADPAGSPGALLRSSLPPQLALWNPFDREEFASHPPRSARGPCTSWTYRPDGRCVLKSAFGRRVDVKGGWSGVVAGGLGRYVSLGEGGAAAGRCGIGVDRDAEGG